MPKSLGAAVSSYAELQAERLVDLKMMGSNDVDNLISRILSSTTVPQLDYHLTKHGKRLGVSTQEEYLSLLAAHLKRNDLRLFTSIKTKGQDRVWHLIAIDTEYVAQYNESKHTMWSFYKSGSLQRQMEEAVTWWVEVVKVGNSWEFRQW